MATKKPSDNLPEVVEAELIHEVVQATGTVVPRAGDLLSQYLKNETEDTDVVEGAGYAAILAKIMSAETEEDLWAESQADKPRDVYLRKLIVRGYHHVDSDFPEGPPVYFAVDAFDTIDERERVILTGNQKIMAKLMRAKDRGLLPAKVMFIQTNKTDRFGRFIEDLVSWRD